MESPIHSEAKETVVPRQTIDGAINDLLYRSDYIQSTIKEVSYRTDVRNSFFEA